ncbi:PucR family transcriptional regulator [Nocardia iowensis]|uniref:Helix-turn-helix domain-containing protein n=1 Tax=Nocardia iowensis TaxID=204891 RepID=A0ABX8RGH5_NOCIO|nr:helix-turn-helix domain-containing protein [Nocardia iowensis]QXN88704.1 helix-turn-helix domain-containing protein [Nocardia iowensis]
MGLEQRRAVVRNLRARLPEVVDTMMDAVAETVPAYRGLDADQRREVRNVTAWVFVRLLDVWSEDSPLTDRDRDRLRAIGAAAAENGRSNTAVLRSYRVAALTGSDLVLDDRDAAHLDRADLRAQTAVLLAGIDELSEAVLAGHTAALDRLTSDHDRALRNLFDDLLTGRHSSPTVLAGRCRELGVALPPEPVLLVTEPTIGAPPAQLGVVDLLRDLGLPTTPVEHLTTVREHRAVLLLPTHIRPALTAAAQARRWRGCLISEHADTHTALAYRLATDALDSAPAHAFHSRPLLDDGDAHTVQLLTTHPATDPDTVARTVLGPLATPSQRHLLEGLAAYLAATSANTAAEHLHLHPQTLRYRLRRAVELTGRDPRDPWQRLTLDIACAITAPLRGDPRPGGA